jgi:hypothetical protein
VNNVNIALFLCTVLFHDGRGLQASLVPGAYSVNAEKGHVSIVKTYGILLSSSTSLLPSSSSSNIGRHAKVSPSARCVYAANAR